MTRSRRSSWEDDYSSDSSEDHRSRPSGSRKRKLSDRKPKEASTPWTESEMERLLVLVQERLEPGGSDEFVNWGDVSIRLGGRTAKQCREKFRNDLRPDITKAPWTLEEEYVLAIAHSQMGNKWSDIAKFLPRRAENTIKNHWYATMRAKADSKTRTFLWTYGMIAGKEADPNNVDLARVRYMSMSDANPDIYPPLETFEVPEDHFTTGAGAIQYAREQQAELEATMAMGTAPIRSATARAQLQQQVAAAHAAATLPQGAAAPQLGQPRRTRTSQDNLSLGGAAPGHMHLQADPATRRVSGPGTAHHPGTMPPGQARPATSPSHTMGSCGSEGGAPPAMVPSMGSQGSTMLPAAPPRSFGMPRTSFDGDASCMIKVHPMSGPLGLPPKGAKVPRRSMEPAPPQPMSHPHYPMAGPHPMAPYMPWPAAPTSSQISAGASDNGHTYSQKCAPPPAYPRHHAAPPQPPPPASHWRGGHAPMPCAMYVVPIVADDAHEVLWAESLAANVGHGADLVTEDLLAEFDLGDDEWATVCADMAPRGTKAAPVPAPALVKQIKEEPLDSHPTSPCYVHPEHSGAVVAAYPCVQPAPNAPMHIKSEGVGAAMVAPMPGAAPPHLADPLEGADIDWAMAMMAMDQDILPCSPPRTCIAPAACDDNATPISTARTGCRPPGAVSRYAQAAANPLPFRVPMGGCSVSDIMPDSDQGGCGGAGFGGSNMQGEMPSPVMRQPVLDMQRDLSYGDLLMESLIGKMDPGAMTVC